jgi:transposase
MVHTMKDQTRGSTRHRRNHDQGFKDDLVSQSLAAGASVSAIAMKGGINANLLFKWRREHVKAMAQRVPAPAVLLPAAARVQASSRSRLPAPSCGCAAPSTRRC